MKQLEAAPLLAPLLCRSDDWWETGRDDPTQRTREEGSIVATRILTTLQDDIDGSVATETVRFGLDGVEWEIDLSERNANRLRNSLSDFMAHGRKVGGKRMPKPTSSNHVDNKAVRKWAEANGIEVNPRGRIPTDVLERYTAAGN
jgi:hypothetical protein